MYPPYVITPYEGIKNAAKDVEVIYNNGKNLNSTKNLAENVDAVIIVAGFTHKDEGERIFFKGGDRDSLRLRAKDEKLISAIAAVNKNIIVVLEGGSAIIIESWKNKVQAILMVWYVWGCVRSHKGFENVFGADWSNHIQPEQAKSMLKRRWFFFVRLKKSSKPSWERDVPFWTIPGTDRQLLCDVWSPSNGKVSGLAYI